MQGLGVQEAVILITFVVVLSTIFHAFRWRMKAVARRRESARRDRS
ncbi:hypothetical protein [Actinomadura fibrosa]|uniref:Uncharacterized protein n=1 Tax=Actinomadura fibrosa TaxID=111802 RepID=A0ABW2XI43_9ACTN|nr:hypothetical protein [Actinomadura fibrosa]